MEKVSIKLNMQQIVVASIVSLLLLSLALSSVQLGVTPVEMSTVGVELAAKLGIKMSTAGLAIDLLSGGSTVWAIIGIIFGASGAGIGVTAAIIGAKAIIKNQGKKAATAW